MMLEGVADDPDSHKIKLFCNHGVVSITGTATVEVYADPLFEGELYIEGGLRQVNDARFSVYSGLFNIGQGGMGQLVACVPDGQNITLGKGFLMARDRIAKLDDARTHVRGRYEAGLNRYRTYSNCYRCEGG